MATEIRFVVFPILLKITSPRVAREAAVSLQSAFYIAVVCRPPCGAAGEVHGDTGCSSLDS